MIYFHVHKYINTSATTEETAFIQIKNPFHHLYLLLHVLSDQRLPGLSILSLYLNIRCQTQYNPHKIPLVHIPLITDRMEEYLFFS